MQFDPAPTRLVFVVLASLRPRVSVPVPTHPAMLLAAPAFVGSRALGGLYMSLGPSLVAHVLGRGDHIVGGLVVTAVAGVGAVVRVLSRNRAPERVVALGLAVCILGPLLLVAALQQRSTAAFFVGAAVSAVGFGAGFQGALRMVLGRAPADQRAGVLPAVYVLSYLAFGVPAVGAGFLAPTVGLEWAADGYAALVVVLGVLASCWRPGTAGCAPGAPPGWTCPPA